MAGSDAFTAHLDQLDARLADFQARHEAILDDVEAAHPDVYAADVERQVVRGYMARTRDHLESMKRSAQLFLTTPLRR